MKKVFSLFIVCFSLLYSPLFALILVDKMMTPEDQKHTGVSKLTEAEQRHLEQWLNEHFVLKSEREKQAFSDGAYVSEIINGGQQVRLSDNSLYELAPEDWSKAQAWIAPTNVQVSFSDNEFYPFNITNPLSGYSVKARLVDKIKPKAMAPEEEKESNSAVKEHQTHQEPTQPLEQEGSTENTQPQKQNGNE